MDENFGNDDNHRDNLNEMLHDAESNVDEKNVKKSQQLFDDAKKPLFDGSFPEDNELPITTYHAKKLTCPMGLAVERIHACQKNCILYRKDYKDLHECPVCKASRYKHHKNLTELDSDVTKNGPPAKMLWYLPIIPRLKKLYANPKDAKLLCWHAEEHKTNGKMRHVADSPQWKNIDRDFKKFGSEIRNIRVLHRHHPYRKKESLFDGTSEDRSMPKLMDGYATLSQVADLNITFRKKVKAPPKHGVNARKDMLAMGIRSELAPQESNGKKIYLPPACYTLSKAEKTSFCECLHVLDHEKLEELQRDIILILCQLEMYFTPSFFDVMVHLVSHIVEEIKIVGLVFLRYMYPFERYMGLLKGYVRNRYRPKGSIIQGLEGVGKIRRKDVTPNTEDLEQAHFTVLQNMTCIEPYIQEHMSYLARKNGHREQRWLEAEHKKTCSQWLADKIIAKQVDQVFYVEDPLDKRWHIVLQSKRSIVGVDDVVDEDEYNKFDELPPFSIGFQSDTVLSDTIYLRSDHQEGQED
nr:hypothetical protein [Tanacetum cinerariifolium]